MKPGWKTTEFWLTLARFGAGVWLVRDAATRDIGVMLLGLSAAEARSYVDSRAALKARP